MAVLILRCLICNSLTLIEDVESSFHCRLSKASIPTIQKLLTRSNANCTLHRACDMRTVLLVRTEYIYQSLPDLFWRINTKLQ
jgi:hypothetical protein